MKFLIWLKEKPGDAWVEQGDGPLTRRTADRIEREIRHLTAATKVLPVGHRP